MRCGEGDGTVFVADVDGGADGGRRGEEAEGVVGLAGRFPWEATESHAAEDYGERPNVCRLWVVFNFIADFWGEIWV